MGQTLNLKQCSDQERGLSPELSQVSLSVLKACDMLGRSWTPLPRPEQEPGMERGLLAERPLHMHGVSSLHSPPGLMEPAASSNDVSPPTINSVLTKICSSTALPSIPPCKMGAQLSVFLVSLLLHPLPPPAPTPTTRSPLGQQASRRGGKTQLP